MTKEFFRKSIFTKFTVLLAVYIVSHAVTGQSAYLREKQEMLAVLGEKILKEDDFASRQQANEEFTNLLADVLRTSESFDFSFDGVKNLSRLQSNDKVVNVFTWLLPLAEINQYHFKGILQIKDKNNRIHLHILTDNSADIPQPEYTALHPARWYGALYYQIIDVRQGNQTYYTLIGFRPQGKVIQRKVLDALVVKSPKNISFGAQIFYVQDFVDRRYMKKPFRLFYDYSANVSATLRYNEKEKMIIMDHLAPPDASKKGIYAVYGPDFSYDGLYWNNGHWHLKEQIKFDTGIKDEIPSVPPPVRRKF